ncbi:unnamed protein product [Bursaphelenchus okinawaensis]|uniref:Uncharacterized protein n=1 Tax=Bursaphelenchus okinawaensis TaxID=465554 RepID=A0A811K7Y1_9BILA|nr:unnamed protein product [Bursaphelenchus okinawaensis]CAG9093516.1 unnamed protein product [Bursaphelenchus okinawaensis]
MILELTFIAAYLAVCYYIDQERQRFGKSRVPYLCRLFDQFKAQTPSVENLENSTGETVPITQKSGSRRSARRKSPMMGTISEIMGEDATQKSKSDGANTPSRNTQQKG